MDPDPDNRSIASSEKQAPRMYRMMDCASNGNLVGRFHFGVPATGRSSPSRRDDRCKFSTRPAWVETDNAGSFSDASKPHSPGRGGGCETSFSDQQENRTQFDQLVAFLNPNRLGTQQINIRGVPHRLHGWKICLVDDIGADILRD